MSTNPLSANKPIDNDKIWSFIRPHLESSIDSKKLSSLEATKRDDYIERCVMKIIRHQSIPVAQGQIDFIKQRAHYELFGLGLLEPLLTDPAITDILINGVHEIYIETDGALVKTPLFFRDQDHLMHILFKMLAQAGKRLDTTRPYVDGHLTNGSRFNAVVTPVADQGPYISIRKFPETILNFEGLIEKGFMDQDVADFIKSLAISKHNMIIAGGASSGKTTLLNAILQQLNPDERIVVIEDTPELSIKNRQTLRLQTVEAQHLNTNITQRDLLKNALRMRPDRVIVGEIRGDEIIDFFQAMNIGHDGTLTTVHASYPDELSSRLLNLSIRTGLNIDDHFVINQIATCIQYIIHCDRFQDGRRHISRICEIVGQDGHQLKLIDIYQYTYNPRTGDYETSFYPENISANSSKRLLKYQQLPTQ